jgi:hypothetical protein
MIEVEFPKIEVSPFHNTNFDELKEFGLKLDEERTICLLILLLFIIINILLCFFSTSSKSSTFGID